ncbi:MAG: hypothetical protein H7321_09305 [Bacteroidia bacterium]|nr:hypothetical protein [Bacteroidia bacterium]
MPTIKPLKIVSGKIKELISTDTIMPNHLAPSGNDGDMLIKDSTLSDGKRWGPISYESPLTFSTGLTRTGNTITNNLSTGIAGGQSIFGGIAAGENLTLNSTSNATKGKIFFGANSVYDEVSNRLGLGTTNPGGKLELYGDALASILNFPSATSYGALVFQQGGVQKGFLQLIGTSYADASLRGNLQISANSGNITMSTNFVGIGTELPRNKVEIAGAISVTGALAANIPSHVSMSYEGGVGGFFVSAGANSSTRGTYIFNQRSSTAGLSNNAIEIKNDGNILLGQSLGYVGVGTTNPLNRFHVKNATNENFIVTGGQGLGNGTSITSVNDAGSTFQALEFRASLFNFAFGNVLINTSTDSGYKLDVNGTGRFASNLTLITTPTTSASTYDFITRNISTGVLEKVTSASMDGRYILNQTSQQATSNFNISGAGVIGTALSIPNNNANGLAPSLYVQGANAESTVAKFWRGGSEKAFYISESNNTYVNLASEGALRFKVGVTTDLPYSSGVDGMTILSSGNVGIGTTNPLDKLHLSGVTAVVRSTSTSYGGGESYFGDAGIYGVFISSGRDLGGTLTGQALVNSSYAASIAVGGTGDIFSVFNYPSGVLTSRFRVTSSGNVIVGSTTGGNVSTSLYSSGRADYKAYSGGSSTGYGGFYINGGDYGSSYLQFGINDGVDSANTGGAIYYDTRSGVAPVRIMTKGTGTTIMSSRIDVFSDGNVGINTANINSGYKLDVTGTGRFTGNLNVGSGNGIIAQSGGTGIWSFTNGAGGGFSFEWIQNGSTAMKLTTDNNLIVTKLATGLTAPATTGTTKMVIVDANGLLSNATIPTGTLNRSINTISASTTLGSAANTDYFYFCTGTITATLPTAVGNTNRYVIKNKGAGIITLATTSSQLIDGASTYSVQANSGTTVSSIEVMSDGINWVVINNYYYYFP